MGEFRFSPFFLPLTTPSFLPPCKRPLHGAGFVRSLRFFQVFKIWLLFKNNYKFKWIIRENFLNLNIYFFSFNELWIYFRFLFLLNLANQIKKRKKRKFLSNFAPCKGRLRGFVERGSRGKIVGTIGSPLICPLSNEVLNNYKNKI